MCYFFSFFFFASSRKCCITIKIASKSLAKSRIIFYLIYKFCILNQILTLSYSNDLLVSGISSSDIYSINRKLRNILLQELQLWRTRCQKSTLSITGSLNIRFCHKQVKYIMSIVFHANLVALLLTLQTKLDFKCFLLVNFG